MANTTRNNSQNAVDSPGSNCFVCDAPITGNYYTLATCRTQKSKVRLIEKLGQLVGDEYMVVISEDDVICRPCTSMINNLDRLEREMFSVRTVVLRFLERKYDLAEGELVNSSISIPPQKFNNVSNVKTTGVTDACTRKRKAAEIDADEVELVNGGTDNTKKTAWLQCDTCKYRTPYNSFMVNHIQRHTPQNTTEVTDGKEKLNNVLNEPLSVSKPTVPETIPDSKPQTEEVEPRVAAECKSEGVNLNNTNVISQMTESKETVEMITPEVQDLEVKVDVNEINGKVIPVNIIQEVGVVSPKPEFIDEQQIATLEVEGEEGILDTTNAICMVDENGMIVQNMEQAEDGTFFVRVIDSDTTKQVLSVSEDGTIEMVEVLWNDIGATTGSNEDDNIPF